MIAWHHKHWQSGDLTANVSLSNVTGMRLNHQHLKSKPSRKNGHASWLNANGSKPAMQHSLQYEVQG